MNVIINNKSYQLNSNSDLNSILKQLKIEDQRGLAVAINNLVIPRSEWEKIIINENDTITLIKATAGG